jgi:tetratricopeptide (TPR) repeat protein
MKIWLWLLLAAIALHSYPAGAESPEAQACASNNPRIAVNACTALLGNSELRAKEKAVAFFQRGMAHFALGQKQEAVNDLTWAIENDATDAFAYLNRGMILQQLGRPWEAIEDATKAIAIAPTLPAAYANRSWAHQEVGKLAEAVRDATRAIGLNPRFAQAYANRAVANLKRRHVDAAIADYSISTRLDDRNAGALRQLGLLKFYGGDFAGSAENLAQALALNDDVYTALFLHISRARLGDNSKDVLSQRIAGNRSRDWPFPVLELFLGLRTPEATLAAASNPGEQCEANFYVGQRFIIASGWESARRPTELAVQLCPEDFIERDAAAAEMVRVSANLWDNRGGTEKVEYLSDIPRSVYEWLEGKQRQQDNGSCRTTRNKCCGPRIWKG